MKKEFKLNRLFVFMLVLGCSFSFTACNDDDDPTWEKPDVISPAAMFGDYTGKMNILTVSPTESEGLEGEEETPAGLDISAKVNNDTVYFENFPIRDIVLSIVNDEETADKIIEAVGNVKYKIGYTPTLTEAKDSVKFVLDPKPLKLAVSIPSGDEDVEDQTLNIEVKVSQSEGGNYELKTTKLKFKFNAEKVMLDEGEGQVDLPNFTPTTFDLLMEKTEK